MQHRPKYHFLPEKNWMNDPNAPICHQGVHHLFYQYNPTDWHWGNLHWGHATSRDLVHWEHQPIALSPAKERGETNCYSGSSYLRDGKIELIYTSVGPERRNQIWGSEQWVAVTEDQITWKQIPENPILTRADNGGKTLTQWRDPFYFRYRGQTYLLVAGIEDGKYGATHIYRTEDYRSISYLNTFYHTTTPNDLMECPNVVVFGDRLLFLYSLWNQRGVRYLVGTMDDAYRFVPERGGIVDPGDFFASQISFDENGRVLMWGWLREFPRNLIYTDGEWAGVQAFPRELSLDEGGDLVIRRLKEIETLRRGEEWAELRDFAGEYTFATRSNTFELCVRTDTRCPFTIRVLASDDGREYTDIVVDPSEGVMRAIVRNASLLEEVDKNMIRGTFRRAENGVLNFDMLVDCSVIECFANDTGCLSPRAYPVLEDGRISILAGDKIGSLDAAVYEMAL